MMQSSDVISPEPESNRTILRFASGTNSLEPDCSFWIGFAGNGSGTSNHLANQQNPKIVLDMAQELGMVDTPATIISHSSGSEHWFVYLTRDMPDSEESQGQWVKQLASLLGQWTTTSIGISLPKSLVESFLDKDNDKDKAKGIQQQLVIKAIHGLSNTYQIQNFYFYIKDIDTNKATNFLLVLRNLLKTANIATTVFH